MITFILITAYILNVFLNRYLNKLIYKNDNYKPIVPLIWFIPLPVMVFIYLTEEGTEKSNWFTGKNW